MDAERTSWRIGARRLWPGAAAVCLLISSCAVPVAPSGGPPDDTPPALVSSVPADGSTGFSGRSVELTFSEHIDRQRFAGAVSLQPDPGGRLEYDWDGRTVTIRFPDAPRAETTYILTIDNSMRDVRNVALDRPVTIAFATGSTINSGRLGGRVIRAADGTPAAGVDVWAYADADSALFSGSPLYRTQTASDGTFSLSYLRETDYFVVGVRDANGNRKLDSNEALALGPRHFIRAEADAAASDSSGGDAAAVDSVGADSTRAVLPEAADLPVWILTRYDDLPPTIDRVVSTGRRHVEVRFSEPVRLLSADAAGLSLTGPAGESSVSSVYATGPDLRRTAGLVAEELTPGTWTLTGRFPVADSSGNPASPVDLSFEVSAGEDAAEPLVSSFLPDSSAGARFNALAGAGAPGAGAEAVAGEADPGGTPVLLWPGDSAGVRFDIPAPAAAADGHVSARDTSGADLTGRLRRSTPTLWMFEDGGLGEPFELIASPEAASTDSAVVIRFQRAARALTGELSGVAVIRPDAPGGSSVVIEARRSGPGIQPGPPIRTVTVSEGPFLIRGLPGGVRVTLRAFLDANGNGTWDAGRPVPFEAPEPISWLDAPEPARARWETALSDTLFIDLNE